MCAENSHAPLDTAALHWDPSENQKKSVGWSPFRGMASCHPESQCGRQASCGGRGHCCDDSLPQHRSRAITKPEGPSTSAEDAVGGPHQLTLLRHIHPALLPFHYLKFLQKLTLLLSSILRHMNYDLLSIG